MPHLPASSGSWRCLSGELVSFLMCELALYRREASRSGTSGSKWPEVWKERMNPR